MIQRWTRGVVVEGIKNPLFYKRVNFFLVEMRGIEPLTSALRTPRSPS
jgi:hypothetical protein